MQDPIVMKKDDVLKVSCHTKLRFAEPEAQCILGECGNDINVRDASFFVFHAIEREFSLSNNATLSQSELIRMFFISYDKHGR